MLDIESVKAKFGIQEFRASQKAVIEHTLDGNSSLVLMPTGTGKSLCYQVPALLSEGLTVVISPLVALMQDQVSKLREKGIDAAYINSLLSKPERIQRYREVKDGKFKLLYVSPERFRKDDFIDAIQSRTISLLAIDEAHCISQWGHDFRPDYTKIPEFRATLGNPVTMALTATATPNVQNDIIKHISNNGQNIKVFNDGICRPNLWLGATEYIDEREKFEALHSRLTDEKELQGSVIIYFNLIKNLEKFSQFLEAKKIKHRVYHGKLSPSNRKKIQSGFLKPGPSLLLATNAFGMGIDKPDIRAIYHAELPASLEAYYQEIGRAGRDGKHSRCEVFYCQDDLAVLMEFIEWQNPSPGFMRTVYTQLVELTKKPESMRYEDLQEKVVYKNKGDHRLQTALNLLERQGITEGDLEMGNLSIVSDYPEAVFSESSIQEKKQHALQNLYHMLQYLKSDRCRRESVYEYFDALLPTCENCDHCQEKKLSNK